MPVIPIGTDTYTPADRVIELKTMELASYMVGSNNLSDIDDVASARTNLGVYSKSESESLPVAAHNQAWSTITSTPTTLAGYGITDGVSSSHTHTFASITSKPTTLSGYGITDAYTKTVADSTFAAASHAHAWSVITGKPTTLAGYGITDAASSSHTHTFASITSKPTNLSGYGITDAYTKTVSDSTFAPISHNQAWSTITGRPTTLSGYGITDAASSSHTHTFASITSKPTTLSGYGITDAQASNSNLTQIAGLTPGTGTFLASNGTGWNIFSGSSARSLLGLGTVSTLASQTTISDSDTNVPTSGAVVDYASPKSATVTYTASSPTITSAYNGRIVECNGTFGVQLPNSMPTGFQITIVNIGTGTITMSAAGTIYTKDSNVLLESQYGAVSAYHRGSNVWVVFGDLS